MSGRKSRSPSSNKGPNTIGNLQRGTPCVVRSPPYQDIYGYIQGLTADNKNVEVYVPLFEYCIYVARKCILPVQTLPQEFSTLRKSPTAQGTGNVKYSREPIASRVFYNRVSWYNIQLQFIIKAKLLGATDLIKLIYAL